MSWPRRVLPIITWLPRYRSGDFPGDLAAGLTVAAMLVPQAMAYALLAGLPPEVGLYAATVPLLAYAVFGTSRQLAVGPVAIVSLLTASALAGVVEEGSASYLEAAAVLALLVGAMHLVLGAARLGFLVQLLSHAVLVGFTAAAALIIGASQLKNLLGIPAERKEAFADMVAEVARHLGDLHGPTVAVAAASLAALVAMKRWVPRAPAALVVVVGATVASRLFDLVDRGVATVGDIPSALPSWRLPGIDGSLVADLAPAALVITEVGFMESVAVSRVYARREGYEVDANQELIGLGMANVASGVFGGYPVTGGLSRTAVNATAGARTPLASVITGAAVAVAIAVLTPALASLPQAALAAVIVMAVVGLIDAAEARHILRVKRSDAVSMATAFVATLAIGIEWGVLLAVVVSLLVVLARLSRPHVAVLGRVPGTTTFRNVDRFTEVELVAGVRVVRVDAAVSFANSMFVKRLLLDEAEVVGRGGTIVLDASGVGDLDTTGADTLAEVLDRLDEAGVALHVAETRGPVRDVLHRSGLWDRLGPRMHPSVAEAVDCATRLGATPTVDHRTAGVDERGAGPCIETPSGV